MYNTASASSTTAPRRQINYWEDWIHYPRGHDWMMLDVGRGNRYWTIIDHDHIWAGAWTVWFSASGWYEWMNYSDYMDLQPEDF